MGELISLNQYKNYKEKKREHDLDAELDKQYEEFIALLRYFAKTAPVKHNMIHIEMVNRSEFIIKDYNKEGVQDQYIQMDYSDSLLEDWLISKMMEHTSKKYYIDNSELLDIETKDTLKSIFENKVQFI